MPTNPFIPTAPLVLVGPWFLALSPGHRRPQGTTPGRPGGGGACTESSLPCGVPRTFFSQSCLWRSSRLRRFKSGPQFSILMLNTALIDDRAHGKDVVGSGRHDEERREGPPDMQYTRPVDLLVPCHSVRRRRHSARSPWRSTKATEYAEVLRVTLQAPRGFQFLVLLFRPRKVWSQPGVSSWFVIPLLR